MEGPALGTEMADLGPAGKSVRDNSGFRRALLDRGDQHALGDSARYVETVRAIAKRSRHSAASCIRCVHPQPGNRAKERELGPHSRDRLLMAMAVHQRASADRWRGE